MIPMVIVLGNTKISEISGISVAGATPELTKFTPPADVEFLFYDKPKIVNEIPVTPEGHPTPAIITKAARKLAGFPILVVRGGTYLAPLVPHIHISDYVGGDFRRNPALKKVREIIEKSEILGREFQNMNIEEIVIGESTPGGTTTAMAVLNSLGYKARTSSASPENPIHLKIKVIEEGFKRCGIERGELKEKPIKALERFGDPMLASITGISLGFNGKIKLAGGTQMLAVAALLKSLGENMDRFEIITTRWIEDDGSSTFKETADEIGIQYQFINLNFSKSRFKGLRDYENGYVKEGVGAGGASWLALKKGFKEEDIVKKVEEIYEHLLNL